MKTISIIIATALAFVGCATSQPDSNVASKASIFANSATGQHLQMAVIDAALVAATEYAMFSTSDAPRVVSDTLYGSAAVLRSTVNTPAAESPQAIARAVTMGAGLRSFDNTVAPIVAGYVMKLQQGGVPPDQAIENAATTLDFAAAAATKARSEEKK